MSRPGQGAFQAGFEASACAGLPRPVFSLAMQLRRLLSLLVALAIITIAGAFASAPALAHKGHSHPVESSAVAAAIEATFETLRAAEAPPQYANFVEQAQHAVASGLADWPVNEGQTPCDGHCCLLSASPCCSFMPAVSSQSMACAPLSELGSPPPGDRVRDGLAPDSLLRPPQSQV
jgi:hypothetical protein